MRIILIIFKTGEDHRAVIGIGRVPRRPPGKEIIYKDIQKAKDRVDSLRAVREMKEKAKKWADEQGIKYVENIDFNPYP